MVPLQGRFAGEIAMRVADNGCQAEWEDVGQVTVVRFVVAGGAEVQEIIELFDRLERLLRDDGGRRVLLNFAGVKSFTSYPVGKLIAVDRRLRKLGGRLALCNLPPVVSAIIDLLKLRRQLTIFATEQDALQSL
jgi:anti-anti-sigma factor